MQFVHFQYIYRIVPSHLCVRILMVGIILELLYEIDFFKGHVETMIFKVFIGGMWWVVVFLWVSYPLSSHAPLFVACTVFQRDSVY